MAKSRAASTGTTVHTATDTAAPADTRRESLALMIGLSAGHGVKHFCQGAFLILMPNIRSTLGLSDVAVGGIFTAQQISSGAMNAPAGVLTDLFRRHVALMLTISMICVTLAYLMVGFAPWYWVILVAVVFLGAGTSMWHSPAFATLAARYPERRGLAMASHLTGAQAGDTIGPVVVGLLIGGLTVWGLAWGGLGWRTVAFMLTIPAALTAITVATMFRSGATGAPPRQTVSQYLQNTGRLMRNAGVLAMVALHALRGATHQSFQVFLVIYLSEVLEYSSLAVGLHVSLLTLAGIASTPVMGVVSDRIGRKPVIVASMAATAVIIFTFIWIDSGWPLAVMLAMLGVVLFSVMPIITAAAMDVTDRGSEGTSIAMMFAGGAVIGAFAPVIAGAINSRAGFEGVVIFAGITAVVSVIVALIAPIVRRT